MEDIDNNKLMRLLIIAEGSLLLCQEHIKKGKNKDNGGVLGQEKEIVKEHIIRS